MNKNDLAVAGIVTKLNSLSTRRWQERNHCVYINVTSDGTPGGRWVERLEKEQYVVTPYTKSVLISGNFQPTPIMTSRMVILKGMIFEDDHRTTDIIRAVADGMNLVAPHPQTACLLRKKLSDEDIEAMGLGFIVVMHDPIKDGAGYERLLGVSHEEPGRVLGSYYEPNRKWLRSRGFAFAVKT